MTGDAELGRQRNVPHHRDEVRRLAVADVTAGMSLVGAAALWGLDVSTLAGWLGSHRPAAGPDGE